MVEKVLENIVRNNGLVVYGFKEVEEVVNYGVVEMFLVFDEFFKGEFREKVEELMDVVRYFCGEVVVVSLEYEGGEKLKVFGGFVVLLRFRVK